MYRWILIFLMLPVVALSQSITPSAGGGGDADTLQGRPLPPNSSPSDNQLLKVDTTPDPDTFYWANDNSAAGGDTALYLAAANGIVPYVNMTGDTVWVVGSSGGTDDVHVRPGTGDKLVIWPDTIIISGDRIQDFNGDGLSVSSNILVAVLGTKVDGSELDTGLKDSITTAYDSSQVMDTRHNALRSEMPDSAAVVAGDTAGVLRANMSDSARVAAGDSARVVKLNEVNNPDGDKTFSMGAFGLNFTFANPSSNGFELNFGGVFTGEGFHVHQHTGNVSAVNLVTFEGTDTDVMTLRVIHAGRDTLSIFTGGLSQFDSIDVNGALRADGSITTPNLIVNTDANIAADAVQDSSIANIITIDEASDVDTTGTKIAAALADRVATDDPRHWIFNLFSPNLIYDDDTQICIDLRTEAAITVTRIDVTLDADPTTELEYSIKFADAFIGLANATVIEDTATVAGVTTVTSITGDATVPTNKAIYIQFEADPDANITQVSVNVTWDYD